MAILPLEAEVCQHPALCGLPVRRPGRREQCSMHFLNGGSCSGPPRRQQSTPGGLSVHTGAKWLVRPRAAAGLCTVVLVLALMHAGGLLGSRYGGLPA